MLLERGEVHRFNWGSWDAYKKSVRRLEHLLRSCTSSIQGALTDLIPLIPASLPFSSVLDHWPPHFVFYELEPEKPTNDSNDVAEFKHIELKKSYLLDLMVLNPELPQNQRLSRKYYFSSA